MRADAWGGAALILDGCWNDAVFKVHLFESASSSRRPSSGFIRVGIRNERSRIKEETNG